MSPIIIDLHDVMSLTTLSRSTIYALVKSERFPKPYRIRGTTRTAWKADEVRRWVEENIEEEGAE